MGWSSDWPFYFIMKRNNTYKGKLPYQSEFDHVFACWANNHNGWAKAKKFNRRLAKRRLKEELRREMLDERGYVR